MSPMLQGIGLGLLLSMLIWLACDTYVDYRLTKEACAKQQVLLIIPHPKSRLAPPTILEPEAKSQQL